MFNFFKRIFSFNLPTKNEIKWALFSFSKREWQIFIILSLVLVISTLVILQTVNRSLMVEVPIEGGKITEGLVGSPRFINPVLAFSDTDRDMTSLVYSGLMRRNSDGSITPDLAESYEMSSDGLTYTFVLKDKIFFHDDEPISADDIVFTIEEIKNPVIKSPRKGNWDGVEVEKIDEKTVSFTLRKPYSSFLENATLGILPEHIWKDSPIELNEANTAPIGSGPFKVKNSSRDAEGLATQYTLSAFKKFSLGQPYLKELVLKFYPNEEELLKALKGGDIDQASSISPENATTLEEKERIESSILPRVFGLFFNQSQNQIFTDKNVVKAIDLGINKDRIIKEVLLGYGVAIDDPMPVNLVEYQELKNTNAPYEENLEKAQALLEKDGWQTGENGYLTKTVTDSKKKKTTTTLSFSIATGNAPELAKTAELIKEDLASLGIDVEIKTFEVGNLNQMVIRPRKYDALLFGQIINYESDLYAFWHSSQRKDPGLNVAMYTNAKVDKILEDALTIMDKTERAKKYAQFEDEIKKDLPAVFLYSPSFIYVVSKDLGGLSVSHLSSPRDRFGNAYLWYTETDNVWKIFSN